MEDACLFWITVKKDQIPECLSIKYWQKVFMMKTALGLPAFPNLNTVMKLLLILPFSNASVERVFSTLKNCKTIHINKLKTATMVCLITTKER